MISFRRLCISWDSRRRSLLSTGSGVCVVIGIQRERGRGEFGQDLYFSFYTRWPLSGYVEKNWPEVRYKFLDLITERSTWHYKYDAHPSMRDEPPNDNVSDRAVVTDDIQHAIWNNMLGEGIFVADKAELVEKIKRENSKRYVRYGHTVYPEESEGYGHYLAVRINEGMQGTDAPEYLARKKDLEKVRKRRKVAAQSQQLFQAYKKELEGYKEELKRQDEDWVMVEIAGGN